MLRKFLINESGATAIEYGLIAALISVAVIVGYSAVGNGLSGLFGQTGPIQNTLNSAN